MPSVAPSLPDERTAAETIEEWARGAPELARLIASGLAPAQGVARWARRLLQENRTSDAVTAFGVTAALLPGDPGPWLLLGVALDRSRRPEESAWCLERSVALHHRQPDTWALLGIVREKLDDPKGAEAAYRVALEQEPSFGAAWKCLGLLVAQRRDYGAAIEAFRACVALGETDAALWANLGRLYYQSARLEEAEHAYRAALGADPSSDHHRRMLHKVGLLRALVSGDPAEAAAALAAQTVARAEQIELLEAAAGLLSEAGRRDAALRIAEMRLALDPASAAARHLLRALGREPGLSRCPPEYIVELFDAFAGKFDAKLVGLLGYDVPEQLAGMLGPALAERRPIGDALDAGCGTGLCGSFLRPLARSLTGVDLSPKMLERAAARNVYDALVREDLVAFLEEHPARFDLVVAADVFIYFGDLAPLFAAAATALRPEGLFAFSVESHGPADAAGGADDYRALASGRFSHAPEYVRRAAGPAFALESSVPTTLRLHAAARVAGHLFLLRRRSGG